jgi:hypothetical protein
MSLSRIQKTFVRLATNHQSYWSRLSHRKTHRRKVSSENWQFNEVKVEIINAVTGEKTTGKTLEDSPAKLKKWLKLRNIRAEFTDVLIKKNSTWSKLPEEEFDNYPVIVRVGSYKVPYVIAHVRDRVTFKKRTTCTFLLATIDNVNYLELINEKKELLEKSKTKKGSK